MTWLPGVATAWRSDTALQVWLAKLLDPQSNMTIIEHNSGVIYVAQIMDMLSGPAEAALAGNAPYRYVDIYGSNLPPNAAATVSTQRVPLYGVLPRPTDSERALWWDALADVIERLDYHDSTTASGVTNAPPADAVWVAVAGDTTDTVYTSWEYDANTVVQEPRDLAAVLPQILLASFTFAQRLKTQATGGTTATATATTPIETAARPAIQALANAVTAADTRANWMAAAAGGVMTALTFVGGLVEKAMRKRVRA